MHFKRVFTLEDLNQDGELVVGSSGETSADINSIVRNSEGVIGIRLALPCGDDGVTRSQLGERANVEGSKYASSFGARKGSTLNGGAISDNLIRVDSLGKFLTTEESLSR